MVPDIHVRLQQLSTLSFEGKAEAFVEAKFITPLLECLGYESHKDYEVIRHGDDESVFKVKYPAVESGSARVKHYNPDYVPTIRKKVFWVIEAKSPKAVKYPFEPKYLIQGLQYCIHPEIQAKYLLITTGETSALYDAHGAAFMGKDSYEPILTFAAKEVLTRWSEIFEWLSVERLRTRIETDLKVMYDKLALSSLDERYPHKLLSFIGKDVGRHARTIEDYVRRLYLEKTQRITDAWRESLETASLDELYLLMETAPTPGVSVARIFARRSLQAGISEMQIFEKVTCDFDRQSIFRKMHSFHVVCILCQCTKDATVSEICWPFLNKHKEGELPILNQVECAFLRLTRKFFVISLYPELRARIQDEMATAPELERFVAPPNAFSRTLHVELDAHAQLFARITTASEEELRKMLQHFESREVQLDPHFSEARSRLQETEIQTGGFEGYGLGGRHFYFGGLFRSMFPDVH